MLMPLTPLSSSNAESSSTSRWLFAVIAILLALQAWLAFHAAANWDEFRFLADVHELDRGELAASVQTFHAQFFQWLPLVSDNEIDQIIAARVVMLVIEAATCFFIYQCARIFAGKEHCLLAVTWYLTITYVLQHGASFRFDPIATCLLMAALAVAVARPVNWRTSAGIGILVSIAALVTIKAIFYLPTLGAIVAWRTFTTTRRAPLVRSYVVGFAVGAASLALLYLYHDSLVVEGSPGAEAIVSGSVSKTIGESRIFPRGSYFMRSLISNPVNWVILLASIVIVSARLLKPNARSRMETLALIGFAAPLATLLFYRNAFPYYYAFMLAPVAVLTVLGWQMVSRTLSAAVLIVALAVPVVLQVTATDRSILQQQHRLLDGIHAMFPTGSPYLDRCSMVSSWRKRGIFMSTWGVEVYRAGNRPIYREILSTQQPAFVVANSPMIETALTGRGDDRRMLPQDAKVLRDNFIPHWGPVWIAGKSVEPGHEFEIVIAGRYTVEASGPVSIDSTGLVPGAVVDLTAGRHWAGGDQPFRLRSAASTKIPADPSPSGPLFSDF